jgi:hypothetical protein
VALIGIVRTVEVDCPETRRARRPQTVADYAVCADRPPSWVRLLITAVKESREEDGLFSIVGPGLGALELSWEVG